MLKHVLILTTAATLTAFTTTSRAQSQSGSTGSSSGQTKADSKTLSFIKDAARDNDDEIALAEVGIRKAQNPDLKSFCQMLQQDHTQANQQLQPIAQKYGVSLDQTMKGKGSHEVSKFEKETAGQKWDQKFATEMLKDHQKDIQKYERASTQLQEPDVKQFAQTMIPKLEQHFQHAETVAKEVGVDQSTISSYAKKLPGNGNVGGSSDEFNTSKGSGARQLKEGSSSTDQSGSSSQ